MKIVVVLTLMLGLLPGALAQVPPATPVPPDPDGDVCRGLGQPPQERLSFEEFIEMVGIATGVYADFWPSSANTAVMDAGSFGGSTFAVPADEPVTLQLRLYSVDPTMETTRYILLHNEQQVPVTDENGNEAPYFDVEFTFAGVLGEVVERTFTLPPLGPGVHDIVLLQVPIQRMVESPRPHGWASRMPGQYRMTLVAEGDAPPAPLDAGLTFERLAPELGFQPGQDADTSVGTYVTITLDPADRVQWAFPEQVLRLAEDQPLVAYALVGAAEVYAPLAAEVPPVSRFALLAFVNEEQVPVQDDALVFYGEVDLTTSEARLPVRYNVPQDDGIQRLMLVRIDAPCVPLCLQVDRPEPDADGRTSYRNLGAVELFEGNFTVGDEDAREG